MHAGYHRAQDAQRPPSSAAKFFRLPKEAEFDRAVAVTQMTLDSPLAPAPVSSSGLTFRWPSASAAVEDLPDVEKRVSGWQKSNVDLFDDLPALPDVPPALDAHIGRTTRTDILSLSRHLNETTRADPAAPSEAFLRMSLNGTTLPILLLDRLARQSHSDAPQDGPARLQTCLLYTSPSPRD